MSERMNEPRNGQAVIEVDRVIEVDGLKVRYGHQSVLESVSLAVASGEVYALVGRNGTGKSSLVRCLLGQQKPQAGRIRIFGRSSWRHRTRLMERVGVVPEVPDAPPNMTASQLARFCRRLYPRWDDDAFSQRLERFTVPLDVRFGRLSRGQKSQVQLALALAPRPDLLVLDDPTLGLDAVARRSVFEELAVELADRGTTVFLTSHDLPGIEAMATRIAFLTGGVLRFDEPIEVLKERHRRLVLRLAGELSDPLAAARSLLSELVPLEIRRRGRDVEAVVERFAASSEEELAGHEAVERLEVQALALEEIVVHRAGEGIAPVTTSGNG